MGYAKACARLPAERHADAVRFAPGDERDGLVQIRFACEREHLPVAYGELLYEIATGTWLASHSDPCLQRMAECYVEVRFPRRGQAARPGAAKLTASCSTAAPEA